MQSREQAAAVFQSIQQQLLQSNQTADCRRVELGTVYFALFHFLWTLQDSVSPCWGRRDVWVQTYAKHSCCYKKCQRLQGTQQYCRSLTTSIPLLLKDTCIYLLYVDTKDRTIRSRVSWIQRYDLQHYDYCCTFTLSANAAHLIITTS